jgi:hypothetical protein
MGDFRKQLLDWGVLASIITSLLVYLGYVRTETFYEYYGLKLSQLEISNQDYIFHSVQLMLEVFAWTTLLLLGMFLGHLFITGRLRKKRLTWLPTGLGILGLLFLIISIVLRDTAAYFLVVTLSAGLIGYGYYLLKYTAPDEPEKEQQLTAPQSRIHRLYHEYLSQCLSPSARRWILVLFGGLLLYGAFQTANAIGVIWGKRQAKETQINSSMVKIYGKSPLGSFGKAGAAPGQQVVTGLRLLTYSNGKYFLVPVITPAAPGTPATTSDVTTIILPDDQSFIIEILATPTPTPVADSKVGAKP